jgi:hypothetical protein
MINALLSSLTIFCLTDNQTWQPDHLITWSPPQIQVLTNKRSSDGELLLSRKLSSSLPTTTPSSNSQEQKKHELLVSLLSSIVVGILSSCIASGIFWYYFYSQKPIIEISKNIAKLTEKGTDKPMSVDGKNVYIIKIINKTASEIINVQFELSIASIIESRTITNQDGTQESVPIIQLSPIQIGRSQPINSLMVIDRYNQADREGKYAQQLVFIENLEEKCDHDNTFLLFKIIATHATSGFSKVYEHRYDCPLISKSRPERSIIQLGRFAGKDSLEII